MLLKLIEVLNILNYTDKTLIAVIFFIVAISIEILPVKINPLSWIGHKISNIFMGDIREKITVLGTEVSNIKSEFMEKTAMDSRYRILRFDDEILHDIKHTKEHFDSILIDINVYEAFCERNPEFKNNVAKSSIKHIKDIYQECKEEKKFL